MATLITSYTTGDDVFKRIYGLLAKGGQTFTVGDDYDLTSINMKIGKEGSPPADLTVELYATDGDGLPTGSVLATGSIAAADITDGNTGGWYDIPMTTYLLESGEKYAFTLQSTGGSSGTDYIFRYQSSGATYADGSYLNYSGGNWVDFASTDGMFEVYGNTPTPANPVNVSGTIEANSTVSGAVTIVRNTEVAGAIAAVSTVSGAATVFAVQNPGRPGDYDPDKFWDDGTGAWYADTTVIGSERAKQAGGRFKAQLVAVSDRGKIYFGGF